MLRLERKLGDVKTDGRQKKDREREREREREIERERGGKEK